MKTNFRLPGPSKILLYGLPSTLLKDLLGSGFLFEVMSS